MPTAAPRDLARAPGSRRTPRRPAPGVGCPAPQVRTARSRLVRVAHTCSTEAPGRTSKLRPALRSGPRRGRGCSARCRGGPWTGANALGCTRRRPRCAVRRRALAAPSCAAAHDADRRALPTELQTCGYDHHAIKFEDVAKNLNIDGATSRASRPVQDRTRGRKQRRRIQVRRARGRCGHSRRPPFTKIGNARGGKPLVTVSRMLAFPQVTTFVDSAKIKGMSITTRDRALHAGYSRDRRPPWVLYETRVAHHRGHYTTLRAGSPLNPRDEDGWG